LPDVAPPSHCLKATEGAYTLKGTRGKDAKGLAWGVLGWAPAAAVTCKYCDSAYMISVEHAEL